MIEITNTYRRIEIDATMVPAMDTDYMGWVAYDKAAPKRSGPVEWFGSEKSYQPKEVQET